MMDWFDSPDFTDDPVWIRVLRYPFDLIGGVGVLAGLVSLTFAAYLVGSFPVQATEILFAVYVVLATLLYAVALAWGNVEQRRSRRAEAAPEFVLEPASGALAVSNVGPGPGIDAHVAVSVDGDSVHEKQYPVLRSDESRQVAALDFDADATLTLRVRSETHLTDVTYTVEREYGGEALVGARTE